MLSAKLARAKVLSKKSTTEIVHEALSLYCDELLEGANVGSILEDVGLVGCVEGPVDLSSNVKDSFTSGLRKKRRPS